MKIQMLNLPAQNGLQPIEMKRLGKVVVLAGPNGAGKSRLLKALQPAIQTYGLPSVTSSNIAEYVDALRPYPDHPNLKAMERQLATWRAQLGSLEYDRPYDQIKVVPMVFDFAPLATQLVDHRNMTAKDAAQHAGQLVQQLGFQSAKEGTLAYLQKHWHRNWNAGHPHFAGDDRERDLANGELGRLQSLLQALLGEMLSGDIDAQATLFGMPIGTAQLSEGQRMLLQWCVALHAQGAKLDECILLLDEPEKHLHPTALVETLERLKALVPNGQLWIATHSVHVLAAVDPSAIWYMDQGKVEYAGRTPDKVLRGLLGDGDHGTKLRTFLDLPAHLAHAHFAAQCLLPPGVADVTADKQSKQVTAILTSRAGPDSRLTVLDYGAGRGRLLSALAQSTNGNPDFVLSQRIDYYALDASAEHRADCERALEGVYGQGRRWFDSVRVAREQLDDHSVDVILLCNVLHEVEPNGWIELCKQLQQLIAPEGVLLLVEDHALPVGEMAHPKGFLVLDTIALRTLFALRAGEFEVIDHDGTQRLLAHVIPARALGAVTVETRTAALVEMMKRAKDEVKVLRQQGSSFQAGMKHAFWTQQFANAALALE